MGNSRNTRRCQRADSLAKSLLESEERQQRETEYAQHAERARKPDCNRDDRTGAERDGAPSDLADTELGDALGRVDTIETGREVLVDAEEACEPAADLSRHRPDHLAKRLDREQAGSRATRHVTRRVRTQPFCERTSGEPASARQHQSSADPQHEARQQRQPHSGNTRCSSGSFISCPDHSQHARTMPMPSRTSSWPDAVR